MTSAKATQVAATAYVAAVALLAGGAGSPAATGGNQETLKLTPAGQASARAAVVHKTDLNRNWVGGFLQQPPDPHAQLPCSGELRWSPKESDIVVTGAAEAHYDIPRVVELASFAQAVQTPEMAIRGWQRWATGMFIRCLRAAIAAPGVPVTLVRRMSFPAIGSFRAAYRAIAGGQTQGRYQFVQDWILIAQECVRLQLVVTSYQVYEAGVAKLERRLAAVLAARAAATCVGSA
jgi:hypothetical protein